MENKEISEQEPRTGISGLWFLGGCALSITVLCSLVLSVLLLISTGLNAYLAWILSGYEINVSRGVPPPSAVVMVTPTREVAVAPTATPSPVPTVAAQATEAELAPTATATMVAPDSSQQVASDPTPEASRTPTATPDKPTQPPAASDNTYTLIPIEGEREHQPADKHPDLNLKLREPQLAQFERSLVDISGSGVDPKAPKLSAIFEPDFVATYAVHDWDWAGSCKGGLIQDGSAVLVGIDTTPGEPVLIPQTERDLYQGQYYAVVLYASEDSLTFLYARTGNVFDGYTVHYLGLQTDPNLLALYRESRGSELPGLTLDTPVGIATDELIVAMRDNGTFLDARSRRDWWD